MIKEARNGTPSEVIEADFIIIGAGAVGGMMAYQLAKAGKTVAMIEAGPPIVRDEAIQRFKKDVQKATNAPYQNVPYAPVANEPDPYNYYVQPGHTPIAEGGEKAEEVARAGGQFNFDALTLKGVGGTTWHMTAHAEMNQVTDFESKTLYGVGVDWPVDFWDMLPYYNETNRLWGVAGAADCLQPDVNPDCIDYPMPPIPQTYLDLQVQAKGYGPMGYDVQPMPHARNSLPYEDRPPCCGNATCRMLCPIGAKYDGSVHVYKALDEGAKLFSKRVVDFIEVGEDKQIKQIEYQMIGDDDQSYGYGIAKGGTFILATHAIEVPKVLLASAQKNAPNGVANTNDLVGRFLMSLVECDTQGYAKDPVYPLRGPISATSGVKILRNGPFRKEQASAGSFVVNGGFGMTQGAIKEAESGIMDGVMGEELAQRINDRTARQLTLSSSVEVLPDYANRVTLAEEVDAIGIPRPQINYKVLGNYTWKTVNDIRDIQYKCMINMGADPDTITQAPVTCDQAIISGTARMGNTKEESVTDKFGKSWDHDNLYIVGTCNYPTISVASPTLTAVSLGLRAVDNILGRPMKRANPEDCKLES